MSKTASRITIVILSALTLLFGAYTGVHYFYNYSTTEWFIEDVNGDKYTVIAKEVGMPFFDGNSHVSIAIKDNDKSRFVTSFSCEIDNEGKELSDSNYDLAATDEYIRLSFFDNDGSVSSAYRFYYSDLA